MDFMEYAEGGVGAIIGAGLTILGFNSRIHNIDVNYQEFKAETRSLFKKIRNDINKRVLMKSIGLGQIGI